MVTLLLPAIVALLNLEPQNWSEFVGVIHGNRRAILGISLLIDA
jgi:hypothetical protein